MTRQKPKCGEGTACGLGCISERYSCESNLQSSALGLLRTVDPIRAWSQVAYEDTDADTLSFIKSLPRPTTYVDSEDKYNAASAFASGSSIYMGVNHSLGDTNHQRIFAHEHGHVIDRQLLIREDAVGFDSVVSSSPLPYRDVKSVLAMDPADRNDALGYLADSIGADKLDLQMLYIKSTDRKMLSHDGSDTGYISSTARYHEAYRSDEGYIIERTQAADNNRTQIQRRATGLLNEAGRELMVADPTIAGELIRTALVKGEPYDYRLVVTAISDDPGRIAVLADRLMGSGALVRDLAGSLTHNKVGLGHSSDYYASDAPFVKQNTETFANIFSLHSAGHPLATAVVSYLAPSGHRLLKVAIKP